MHRARLSLASRVPLARLSLGSRSALAHVTLGSRSLAGLGWGGAGNLRHTSPAGFPLCASRRASSASSVVEPHPPRASLQRSAKSEHGRGGKRGKTREMPGNTTKRVARHGKRHGCPPRGCRSTGRSARRPAPAEGVTDVRSEILPRSLRHTSNAVERSPTKF